MSLLAALYGLRQEELVRLNVLVTGCAGFIGSNVAKLLLEAGHAVHGVDSLHGRHGNKLQQWRLDPLKAHQMFTFHRLDISDTDSLKSMLKKERGDRMSAVINLAALAGVRDSVEEPRAYYEVNTLGVLNLLEVCREFDIGKFILASTSSVYGAEIVGPIAEDDQSSRPLSPYAASKKAAETLLYSYHHLYGIDAAVLRFFTVYGPAGRPDMSIFRFIRGITEGEHITVYGDGTQKRDFTYVSDVARGTVGALDLSGYETVNLGNDRPVDLNEVIRIIEQDVGREALVEYQQLPPTDPPVRWANVSLAGRLLGWAPAVNIEEGIRRTVDWYMEHRDWANALR